MHWRSTWRLAAIGCFVGAYRKPRASNVFVSSNPATRHCIKRPQWHKKRESKRKSFHSKLKDDRLPGTRLPKDSIMFHAGTQPVGKTTPHDRKELSPSQWPSYLLINQFGDNVGLLSVNTLGNLSEW